MGVSPVVRQGPKLSAGFLEFQCLCLQAALPRAFAAMFDVRKTHSSGRNAWSTCAEVIKLAWLEGSAAQRQLGLWLLRKQSPVFLAPTLHLAFAVTSSEPCRPQHQMVTAKVDQFLQSSPLPAPKTKKFSQFGERYMSV